jgi:hypothetical protein
MSDMNLPEASMSWVYHFLSRRLTSSIINGKKTDLRQIYSGISQGSPISPLLFLIYTEFVVQKDQRSCYFFFLLMTLLTLAGEMLTKTLKNSKMYGKYVMTWLRNVTLSLTMEIC